MPKKPVTLRRKLLLQIIDYLEAAIVVGGCIGLLLAFLQDWPPDPARKIAPTFHNAMYRERDLEWTAFEMPLKLDPAIYFQWITLEADMVLKPPFETRYFFDTVCLMYLEINGESVSGVPSNSPCGSWNDGKFQYLGEYLHAGVNHIRAQVRGENMRFSVIPVINPMFENASYRLADDSTTDFTLPLNLYPAPSSDTEITADVFISPVDKRLFTFQQRSLKELYVNDNMILSPAEEPLYGDVHFDLSPYLHIGRNSIRAVINSLESENLLFNITPYTPKDLAPPTVKILFTLVLLFYVASYVGRSV